MPWSDRFKNALRAPMYHPRFRLTIGTTEVAGTAASDIWENNKAVQIYSHKPHESYMRSAATGDMFGVEGLVSISMGSRSITPRTLVAQHASCSVTVTNEAASFANECREGTLAKLECDVNGSGFNCIFIGMLKNIKWSGGATSQITMVDALNSLKVRAGEKIADARNQGSDFMWFKNIGEEATLAEPFTASSGTGSLKLLNAGAGGAARVDHKGFPYSYRMFGAYTPRSSDLVFKVPADGGDGGFFAVVSPTDGPSGDVLVEYDAVGIDDASLGSGGFGFLLNPHTEARLGYFDKASSVTDRVFGTGAKVKSALLIHGDPVAELVNCFYQNGYHPDMVYGLFGSTSNAAASEYINWDDIEMRHRIWRRMWESVTTGNAPMRSVVTSTTRDGFTYLSKIFAKFGVFPTWREGSYSVGLMLEQGRLYDAGYSGRVVRERDIVNASWEKTDSSSKATYRSVDARVTDPDSYTASGGNFAVDASPIIPKLDVKISECAAGETAGRAFFEFYKKLIFDPFYANKPAERATVVLGSMSFASMVPGDLVVFDFEPIRRDMRPVGYEQEFRGPHTVPNEDSGSTVHYHVLDSRLTKGTKRTANKIWTVVGVQDDWMAGQVTIECICTRLGGSPV